MRFVLVRGKVLDKKKYTWEKYENTCSKKTNITKTVTSIRSFCSGKMLTKTHCIVSDTIQVFSIWLKL